MVNTRCTSKAWSGSSALAAPVVASVGTQTEPMGREAAVQSLRCRRRLHCCPEGRVSNGQGCTLCSLVEVLLQQVAELQEAVTRLKGVREAEGEQRCLLRDQTVPGPRASTVAHAGKEAADPGSWETVTEKNNKKRRKRAIKSKGLPPTSVVPTQNRFAVLQGADEATHSHQEQPADALIKKITTGAARKKQRAVVVGDSNLKGTEAPICRPDPGSREVCCLPGARIRDVAEKLPALVGPTDCYPLLVIHVGATDIDSSSPETIKKDYRALGGVVRGSGAQIVFSSILQDTGQDLEKARRIGQVNKWLEGWCYSQGFGYLEHGTQYSRPGLLEAGGTGLTKKGKSGFGRRLARLVKDALN
uniref:Uncharacterized protein n=1 Tax=Amazona collaria TaxID=241587 RepID=A0A8B9IV37_9PSIT